MTRKDALQEAIALIEKSRIGTARKAGILAGLRLCAAELPFAAWSRAAIFDACDTFLAAHGRIRPRDFDRAGLPGHTTIRRRFGLTALEFCSRYYPSCPPPARSKYGSQPLQRWNRLFILEFRRIKATGQDDYNRRRDRALPTWNTLARMNGVSTWRALLEKLELENHPRARPRLTVRIAEPRGE